MIVVSRKTYDSLAKRHDAKYMSQLIPADQFPLTTKDVCDALGVSKMTLMKRMDDLKSKGYVMRSGYGKRGAWKFKEEVVEYIGHIPDMRGRYKRK